MIQVDQFLILGQAIYKILRKILHKAGILLFYDIKF